MAIPYAAFGGDFDGPRAYDQPACPVCGGTARLFARPTVIDPQRPLEVDLLQCTQCRHGWISPMPTQAWLDELYRTGAHAVVTPNWENEAAPGLSLPAEFVLRRERNRPPGRYFELGVGKGLLYQHFADAGWTNTGIEPGVWGKFPGVIGSIGDLPHDSRFDLMVAFDVLEHLERPIDFLTRMRAVAEPGTRLYASFPNIDSFRARRMKAKWRMARPLGHTQYYSKASVPRLLRDSGFALTELHTNDLFRLRDVRGGVRSIASGLIQAAGQGDQMLIVATAV